ncbi:MAG TPA: hypothetical protein VG939_16660 [Caulobacteraceae bacterium]|nr:hypothetical protein [Caulobacteraceae bacterium]
MKLRTFCGLAALAAGGCAGAAPVPPDTLTDAAIAAYDKADFDKGAMMHHRVQLGVHHGAHVVADHPCSDLCPNYTVRIVHYDLGDGQTCAGVGGAEVQRSVPLGIGVSMEPFCVPKVLADRAQ